MAFQIEDAPVLFQLGSLIQSIVPRGQMYLIIILGHKNKEVKIKIHKKEKEGPISFVKCKGRLLDNQQLVTQWMNYLSLTKKLCNIKEI